MREQDGLVARIRQMRRPPAMPTQTGGDEFTGIEPGPAAALAARVAALEDLVQGLQDSIHREATRQEKRISELEAKMEPAAIAAALSRDARERGL